MKSQRFDEIDAFVRAIPDSVPVHGFLAKLAEQGVSTAELSSYNREREKQEKIARQARRVRR